MLRRDTDEAHRASTPLELLFDLVSVIAIAGAAAGLHHAIAENHILEGVVKFISAFFAIWWAWMNYTWFASAYDNDDTLFRLLTMVIMAGALTMAAGIGAFFDALDLTLMVTGYVIMRLAMVVLWLWAAAHDREGRAAALRYATLITLAQGYWVIFFINQPLPGISFYILFAAGILIELAAPIIAESKATTPWHRHHIIERYGLLNIIVLGETLLAASVTLESAYAAHAEIALLPIVLSSLVILFSMWWLYFSNEDHLENRDFSRSLVWGYGHVLVFGSGAAVGAGFAVLGDIATDHAKVGFATGHYAVAIPVALYVLGLWIVRDRVALNSAARYVLPTFAVLIVLAPLMPRSIELMAGLIAVCVVLRNRMAA